jgi:hypothetical protein
MLEMFGGDVVLAEAAKQGLWAILYVTLFIYVLTESKRRENRLRDDYNELRNESRERENKLTDFIHDISKQFERLARGVERLTLDVDEIKDELRLRKEIKDNEKGE